MIHLYYLLYNPIREGLSLTLGFPGGLDSKDFACNAGDPGSLLRSGWFHWRREWLPTPVFLPGEFHGQRSIGGYRPGGHKESVMSEWLTLSLINSIFWMRKWRVRVACESESGLVVSDSLPPQGLYSSWNSPGQNTGVGSLSLLQGIFPTQGSNPSLPHCRQILYQLSHKGSPRMLVALVTSSRWYG